MPAILAAHRLSDAHALSRTTIPIQILFDLPPPKKLTKVWGSNPSSVYILELSLMAMAIIKDSSLQQQGASVYQDVGNTA